MTNPPEQSAVDREAADWFARLNNTVVSVEDLEAFRLWAADPRRQSAYARIEAFWRQSSATSDDPDIRAALSETLDKPAQRRAMQRRQFVWGGMGLSAAAATIAIGLHPGLLPLTPAPEIFATRVGERRVVRLDDGSQLHLDTNSSVEVRFGAKARDLKLVSGQALFDVAHDADRPFRVLAGETRVDAIGTRFTVRRDGASVRVTLMQGKVNVLQTEAGGRRWSLLPGEQIIVSPDRTADAITPTAADLEASTSWTLGRLIFRATALQAAIDEVNRYSPAKITLGANVDRARSVSGVFDTGDSTAFADAVATLYDLNASTSADGAITIEAP